MSFGMEGHISEVSFYVDDVHLDHLPNRKGFIYLFIYLFFVFFCYWIKNFLFTLIGG